MCEKIIKIYYKVDISPEYIKNTMLYVINFTFHNRKIAKYKKEIIFTHEIFKMKINFYC